MKKFPNKLVILPALLILIAFFVEKSNFNKNSALFALKGPKVDYFHLDAYLYYHSIVWKHGRKNGAAKHQISVNRKKLNNGNFIFNIRLTTIENLSNTYFIDSSWIVFALIRPNVNWNNENFLFYSIITNAIPNRQLKLLFSVDDWTWGKTVWFPRSKRLPTDGNFLVFLVGKSHSRLWIHRFGTTSSITIRPHFLTRDQKNPPSQREKNSESRTQVATSCVYKRAHTEDVTLTTYSHKHVCSGLWLLEVSCATVLYGSTIKSCRFFQM